MSNQPPIEVPQGAIRFNTDSQKLEFFAQDRWYQMATDTPAIGIGTFSAGSRGINFSGSSGSNTIEFITIPTHGNGVDFGNRTQSVEPSQNACASRTRAFFGGGEGNTDRIEFVTISQQGNGTDFGDQNGTAQHSNGAASDSHGGLE